MTQPGMFSGPGMQVVTSAQEELMALGHDWLGTEHLLLGLMRMEGDGGPLVGGQSIGDIGQARAVVTRLCPSPPEPVWGHIPTTPRARLVLNAAANEAVAEQRDVEPRHVLLALLTEAHNPDTHRSPHRLNPIAYLSDAPMRARRRRERRRWDRRPWSVRIRDPHGPDVARETLAAIGVDIPELARRARDL